MLCFSALVLLALLLVLYFVLRTNCLEKSISCIHVDLLRFSIFVSSNGECKTFLNMQSLLYDSSCLGYDL